MDLAPLLLSLLLSAPDFPSTTVYTTSDEEIGFGIEVARRGLWKEARFRFERAVQLDPDNAAALNDLAVAWEQEGEFGKARDAYEKAMKLKPKNTSIQQNFELFREADDKRNRKSKKKP